MRVAIITFGLLSVGLSGCVRASEGVVRDKAANDFACADYALTVVEVGPDVYRASGCGQELIYACRPTRPADHPDAEDRGDQAVVSCTRSSDF